MDMEGVKVKYKRSAKKDPGTLKIIKGMLVFEPDDSKSDLKLEVESQNIMSTHYSKEGPRQLPLFKLTNKQGRSHFFEFENYPKMHEFHYFIDQAFAKWGDEPKESDEKLSIADLELRIKLLRENSELQRLHKQFVGSKVLRENEFWSTRKILLGKLDSTGKWNQQAGIKNMMVAGIKPSTDGQTNSVTYNLTPEIIFQIFAERPAVRLAFLDYVPSKMTEKDFWTKYFRAEYLYTTKNIAVAEAEAAEEKILAIFLKPDEILARENRRKIRRVDPTIDVVANKADDYTHIKDHGIFHRDNEPQNNQFRRSLALDIYRHSAIVLDGRRNIDFESKDTRSISEALTRVSKADGEIAKDDDHERSERLMSYVAAETEDLHQTFSFVPLSIKDPSDYFESQILKEPRGSRASKRNVHEAYRSIKESVSEIRTKGISDPLITPQVSFEVFSELTRSISTAKNINPRQSRLPKSTKDEILLHWRSIQELLKHFWSSYPITTYDLHTKVGKLKDAVSNAYSELEAVKKSVQSDHRHEVSLLVRSMHETLDAAFQHYEADLQRRSATSCV